MTVGIEDEPEARSAASRLIIVNHHVSAGADTCATHYPGERLGVREEVLIAGGISKRTFRDSDGAGDVTGGVRLLQSVREIARDIGLSQRRLIQVFTSSVGLTPKRYLRVCRFQRARGLAGNTVSPDWARVALECGYFDQSHLIRDFRQFTGFTPGEFQRMQNERLLPSHLAQLT